MSEVKQTEWAWFFTMDEEPAVVLRDRESKELITCCRYRECGWQLYEVLGHPDRFWDIGGLKDITYDDAMFHDLSDFIAEARRMAPSHGFEVDGDLSQLTVEVDGFIERFGQMGGLITSDPPVEVDIQSAVRGAQTLRSCLKGVGPGPSHALCDPDGELERYGYTWTGMVWVQPTPALEHFDLYDVYELHPDNSESLLASREALLEHVEEGGLLGIEKSSFQRKPEPRRRQTLTDRLTRAKAQAEERNAGLAPALETKGLKL